MPFTITYRCPICGLELVKSDAQHSCIYCGRERTETDVILQCSSGHYICPTCRALSAAEIPEHILGNKERRPLVLADYLMAHPAVKQEAYGPDHHWIPVAVLLITARNCGIAELSDARILAAVKRAHAIPMGSCYMSGICGAAAGAGTAVSVLLGVDIHSADRSLVLKVTSNTHAMLSAQGGIRCCKEAVYASLHSALSVLRDVPSIFETAKQQGTDVLFFTRDNFYADGIGVPCSQSTARLHCRFSASMPDCKGEVCPYFSDNFAKSEQSAFIKPS